MKVAVIGAGKVGSAVVGDLMHVGAVSEIVLVSRDRFRAEGEVLDYQHTTSFTHYPCVNVTVGGYEDCADADLAVIAAGPSIEKGQTRIDLAAQNVQVLREILQGLDRHCPGSQLIVVTNPVDVLTYAAYRLSDRPRNRVIGTGTMIDTARLIRSIAAAYRIDPKNVFVYMLGEHGETSFAAWSMANICGLGLEEFGRLHVAASLDRAAEEERAKQAGYEILRRKGYTSHGIAAAVARLVIAIASDEKCILPVSVPLEGEYGLRNTALSVPCVVGAGGVEKVLEFPLSLEERRRLQASADHLAAAIQQAGL
ncbi:MAG: L-lactate dehydrogenase [Fimbriimonadales bacterium]|nr:L-lactate dehydrogenase [Fimbriimonadales bacterium]